MSLSCSSENEIVPSWNMYPTQQESAWLCFEVDWPILEKKNSDLCSSLHDEPVQIQSQVGAAQEDE